MQRGPASSEAQPDHCRKDVQTVGSQRHSQWHPVSKHRESHLQCMQYPPKRNLGERSSTWRKKNGEEERVVPSESNPDALRKKREGGAEEGNQTLFNHQVDLSISKVRRQVRGREGGSRARTTKTGKVEETLLERPTALPQTWIEQIHFGPFHGSNRRRKSRRMITLDLNHFGFQRAGRPERRKKSTGD